MVVSFSKVPWKLQNVRMKNYVSPFFLCSSADSHSLSSAGFCVHAHNNDCAIWREHSKFNIKHHCAHNKYGALNLNTL